MKISTSFKDRLSRYGGLSKVIVSKDFLWAIAIFSGLFYFDLLAPSPQAELVSTIVQFSTSLVAIILTGFAIVISLSSSDFIAFLKRNQRFSTVTFLFEWNAYLALFTSGVGISFHWHQSTLIYYALVFAFIYLITSITNLISYIGFYAEAQSAFDVLERQDVKLDKENEKLTLESTDEISPEDLELPILAALWSLGKNNFWTPKDVTKWLDNQLETEANLDDKSIEQKQEDALRALLKVDEVEEDVECHRITAKGIERLRKEGAIIDA